MLPNLYIHIQYICLNPYCSSGLVPLLFGFGASMNRGDNLDIVLWVVSCLKEQCNSVITHCCARFAWTLTGVMTTGSASRSTICVEYTKRHWTVGRTDTTELRLPTSILQLTYITQYNNTQTHPWTLAYSQAVWFFILLHGPVTSCSDTHSTCQPVFVWHWWKRRYSIHSFTH